MSDGALRAGWRLVRERRGEFLDPARLRRRTVVAGLVAVVVGAALVVSEIAWGFDLGPVRGGIALVLLAAAAGCLAATLVGTAAPGVVPPAGSARGDWRRSLRIEQHFEARPPMMTSDDRDDVIAWADATLGPSVVAADRSVWNPAGFLIAWIAFLVGGASLSVAPTLAFFPAAFGALQCVPVIGAVLAAGRGEAARRRALAVPPLTPAEPAPERRPRPEPRAVRPPGSQLALPDE
ncbi:hypothetical protein [Frigoribacterium sp. Leaf172]|uniref:hypothetical protein n=1 Tax=Frigoribacterium sp. Leaf172 TaxID=1736285 RepID=UPI0006F8BDAE|nr:hypothetical protein [Frigoribacterium sp. Leaf172]KQR66308.1 hypothetical protein ASF89_04090 [Frigoribacterium sp. Leaf172]